MFYSTRSGDYLKAKSRGCDSFLKGQSIYNGSYWDEFGLTVLSGQQRKVLVLGAGYGACVRPLYSQNPDVELTLLDIDREALSRAVHIYSKEFPQLVFKTLLADAELLPFASRTFDAIWIDLYSEVGPVSFSYEMSFLKRCADLLKDRGLIFINFFSAPTYLEFVAPNPWLSVLRGGLSDLFPSVALYPHRRNMTVVAGPKPVESTPHLSALTPRGLHRLDSLMCRLQRSRQKTPYSTFDIDFVSPNPAVPTFAAIDQYFIQAQTKWNLALSQNQVPRIALAAKQFMELSAATFNGDFLSEKQLSTLLDQYRRSYDEFPEATEQWLLPQVGAIASTQPSDLLLDSFELFIESLESPRH